MSTMYVLLAGVTNNGFSVRGVFNDLDLAREAAISVPKSSQRSTWKEVARNRWHCADEYVLLEEYQLNENINSGRPVEFDDTMGDDKPKYFQDNFDQLPEFNMDDLSDLDLLNIYQAQLT